jgi:hypothetical protein
MAGSSSARARQSRADLDAVRHRADTGRGDVGTHANALALEANRGWLYRAKVRRGGLDANARRE